MQPRARSWVSGIIDPIAAPIPARRRRDGGWAVHRRTSRTGAGQIKLFADGAIISQLMQMKDGDLDGHHGEWIIPPEELEKRARLYWNAGGIFSESLEGKAPFFDAELSPGMKEALAINVPGNRKSAAPTLVVHGTADNVVAPDDTKQLALRMTKSGNVIEVSWYEGKNRRTVIPEARNEILSWFDDRLSRKPVVGAELPK